MLPFISMFGSKYRLADLYGYTGGPIVEPFAASAAFSVRHEPPVARLFDVDPCIVELWDYLIHASRSDIMSIPLIREGEDVRSLRASPGARMLVSYNLNQGASGPRRTLSRRSVEHLSRGDSCVWGERLRARIANQVDKLRNWTIDLRSWDTLDPGEFQGHFWFVDPPYKRAGKHYRFGSKSIDFGKLGDFCRSLPASKVAVCEQDGADWLPFRPLRLSKTSRVGKPSQEVVWP